MQVMVLTTSNLPDSIDLAFVDRADIRAYIGPPPLRAQYEILRSCLQASHLRNRCCCESREGACSSESPALACILGGSLSCEAVYQCLACLMMLHKYCGAPGSGVLAVGVTTAP